MASHKVMFIGGADALQLRDGGPVYRPGDVFSIDDIQRASLHASGHRFGQPPEEPDKPAAPASPPPLEPAGTPVAKSTVAPPVVAPTKETK